MRCVGVRPTTSTCMFCTKPKSLTVTRARASLERQVAPGERTIAKVMLSPISAAACDARVVSAMAAATAPAQIDFFMKLLLLNIVSFECCFSDTEELRLFASRRGSSPGGAYPFIASACRHEATAALDPLCSSISKWLGRKATCTQNKSGHGPDQRSGIRAERPSGLTRPGARSSIGGRDEVWHGNRSCSRRNNGGGTYPRD